MQKLSKGQANSLSVLTLAFVGDAVFTLRVRETLCKDSDFKPGMLTKKASNIVSAVSQSKMLETILPQLTEEELLIVKNARNAHTNNKAKNAGLADYKRATSLEALIGFLYLTDDTDRLNEILEKCLG